MPLINDRTYRAALFVEMLHTSSLVHDDLIDQSMQSCPGNFATRRPSFHRQFMYAVIPGKSVHLYFAKGCSRSGFPASW